MKLAKTTLLVAALLTLTGGPVLARGHGHWHGHARVGVFIGGPVFWPGYYYPPYYYPPYYPPYVGPPYPAAAPTYYIEEGGAQPAPAPAPAPSQANWWYHCADAKAYYPYVKECPGGWQRVAPQPLN